MKRQVSRVPRRVPLALPVPDSARRSTLAEPVAHAARPNRAVIKRWAGAFAVALACLAGCGRPVAPDAAAAFRQAQETFDQAKQPADFLRAAAQYQALLDRGIVSGALYYNQGNAFLQAGEKGRAIAAYRQAQRYRPRDPYLDANLRLALGNPAASGGLPLVEQIFFWQNWLSYPEKFAALAAAAGVTLVAACLALGRRRRYLWNTAAVALVVTVVAGASAAYDWWRFEQVRHGVTLAETVARKGNSASYEPALNGPLPAGTEFTLRGRRSDWLHVQLPGGIDGWIPAGQVVEY